MPVESASSLGESVPLYDATVSCGSLLSRPGGHFHIRICHSTDSCYEALKLRGGSGQGNREFADEEVRVEKDVCWRARMMAGIAILYDTVAVEVYL